MLNHTQFRSVDHDLEYDVAGNQVNAQFGEVTAARNPRVMQGSLRLTF